MKFSSSSLLFLGIDDWKVNWSKITGSGNSERFIPRKLENWDRILTGVSNDIRPVSQKQYTKQEMMFCLSVSSFVKVWIARFTATKQRCVFVWSLYVAGIFNTPESLVTVGDAQSVLNWFKSGANAYDRVVRTASV